MAGIWDRNHPSYRHRNHYDAFRTLMKRNPEAEAYLFPSYALICFYFTGKLNPREFARTTQAEKMAGYDSYLRSVEQKKAEDPAFFDYAEPFYYEAKDMYEKERTRS
jgi:hypothetical protein